MSAKHFFIIVSSLVSTLFIRFNRQDLWIDRFTGKSGDHLHYYSLVEVFRNQAHADIVPPPFNSRILISYMASFLPAPADLALNVIIATILLIGFLCAYLTLRALNVDNTKSLLIVILHIFSFPVFYYGAIGYLDSALVGWMMIGLLALVRSSWILLGAVIFSGAFLKETIFILTAVSFVYIFLSSPRKKWGVLALISACQLIGIILVQQLTASGTPSFHWLPELDVLWMNLARPRTFLSYLLSAYPAVLLFAIGLQKQHRTPITTGQEAAVYASSMTGIAIAILISFYSFIAAYADGRFLFLAYPFSIMLSAHLVRGLSRLRYALRAPFVEPELPGKS